MMLAGLVLAGLLGALPPGVPDRPVIIRTDKAAYVGKDHITVTLHNNHDKDVWVAPLLPIERSNGDGSWTPVYSLRAVAECQKQRPEALECVRIPAGKSLTLAPWDWYTGGYDQCPPRRPGKRAFKGVHRISAAWCDGKAPENGAPRVKMVTWE